MANFGSLKFMARLGLAMMCAPLLAQQPWRIQSAVSSIKLNLDLLRDLGISVSEVVQTGKPYRFGYLGFASQTGSDLYFFAPNGDIERLDGGSLQHRGGLVLERQGQAVSLLEFTLRVSAPPNDLELVDAEGRRWFMLGYAHPYLKPEIGLLQYLNMDLDISPEMAEWLGQPSLAGTHAGTVDIQAEITIPQGADLTEGGCSPDFNGPKDVELTGIGSISQFFREPGGRVAFAPSAALRNAGSVDVPWYRAINPDGVVGQHPFLVMHFYRILDGVIEQLGRSDVKHAFFSVNSGCPCPGDQVLYVGCSDVYGASTNGNRFYLAPREELTASTGNWVSLASHFDAIPVDDFRHHGSGGHDDFEHRLFVNEADLDNPGARYFVEVWYIVQDDINIFNSMGYREVDPSFSSIWSFPFLDATHVSAPAIDAWVDPDSPGAGEAHARFDDSQGHLRLAVKTTDMGGNNYRYEYALMNLDFDRQINAVTIPRDGSLTISNTGVRALATEGAGSWTVNVGADTITLTAPGGTGLDWGTMIGFHFDANSPPLAGQATLGTLEPGSPSILNLGSLAPLMACASPTDYGNLLQAWGNTSTVIDVVNALNHPCP